jgi:hypothetical protein
MIRLVLAAAIALAWSPPAHAYRGTDAGGPDADVVVVRSHHVRLIVGRVGAITFRYVSDFCGDHSTVRGLVRDSVSPMHRVAG